MESMGYSIVLTQNDVPLGTVTYTLPSYEMFEDEKVSVDTGKFVPGEYRTNAYFVRSSKIDNFTLHRGGEISRSVGGSLYKGDVQVKSTPVAYRMCSGRPAPLVSDTTYYSQAALQKAAGEVAQGMAEVGEDVFSLRHTVSMLVDPFKALRKVLANGKSLRDAIRRSKTRSNLNAAASARLEYEFGMKPLQKIINDIFVKFFKECENWDPEKIRSAHGIVSTQLSHSQDFRVANSIGYYGEFFVLRRQSDEVTFNATVDYRQESPLSPLDRLGISPSDLPKILWQCTRLSFVADWFGTIGNLISALEFNPGVYVLGNTVGVKTVSRYHATSRSTLTQWTGPSWSDSCETTTESYRRTCNVPMSYVPKFTGCWISGSKIASLLTMVLQTATRK